MPTTTVIELMAIKHVLFQVLFSASLYQYSMSATCVDLLPRPSVSLCVGKVYCGKMADWIQMLFGVVSRVGQGLGVLDRGGYHQGKVAVLGGKSGASHCNQWGWRCTLPKLHWE